jgi:hypothetical protein
VVHDEHVQALADRLAREVLAARLRPNSLTRYGETRDGVVATTAFLAGTLVATVGVYRRVTHTDLFGTERLYAQTIDMDRDRAHADVYYVDQRLRLLALATDDDPEELIRSAAHVLVAFVAAGRPPDQRLDEVEGAFAPLREARDDGQPTGMIAELLPAYLSAWRRALS